MAVTTEQIKSLIELQKVDADAYRVRKELVAFPAQQKKAEDAFDKKKAGLKAAEEAQKATLMQQKSKEGDLLSKEEKIKKLQAQLYQLKTNKEYSAMELEIKGLKADQSLLEEEILVLLDKVEQAKAGAAKEKELLGVEEKKLKDTVDALKKKAGELGAALKELEEKRKTYLPRVDAKLLSQYERILKSREGLALVPVMNNSCGGCHLELPPQAVNEIQMQEKVIICESCARILY